MPSSKSISNRLLILNWLFNKRLEIHGLSDAEDTKVLMRALQDLDKQEDIYYTLDVGESGTAFRFLTAYLSVRPGIYLLTGGRRMQQRPVGPLVEALKELGARIAYVHNQGYPPLYIEGQLLQGGKTEVDCKVSSQFASAVFLIGAGMEQGLEIKVKNLVSASYLQLTINLLESLGLRVKQGNDVYFIQRCQIKNSQIFVEKDWTSASYWYGIVSLAQIGSELFLYGLKRESIQPSWRFIVEFYEKLGVKTEQETDGVILRKVRDPELEFVRLELKDYPDLALTIIVSLILHGIKFEIKGLEHLQYKESDRLSSLGQELGKIGIDLVHESSGAVTWHGQLAEKRNVEIESHADHRILMAMSQLLMRYEQIEFKTSEVVRKSYPEFWDNLNNLYK